MAQLFDLLQRRGLLAGGSRSPDAELLQVALARFQFGAEFAQVTIEDDRDGVLVVAVHIDQHVEAAPRAGEHPVDRALFVHLDVVL